MSDEYNKSKSFICRPMDMLTLGLSVSALVLGAYAIVNARNSTVKSHNHANYAEKTTEYSDDKDDQSTGWNTIVKSGKGAFEATFPDGWDTVLNDPESDSMNSAGMMQPTLSIGSKVEVVNASSGGDGPSLFAIYVAEKDAVAAPEGVATDYTLVNRKENPIIGKKYTKDFNEDTLEGIGIPRLKNDRTYTYQFPLENDKVLTIWYNVYGMDPRNQVPLIEQIIDTIYILK